MSKRGRDIHTTDLFANVFTPQPKPAFQPPFEVRLRKAVSDALHEARNAGKDRPIVAAQMGEFLDNPRFSVDSLNKFAAESNETHNINVLTFMALISVTGCTWLLDLLAREFGCAVLKGEEAILADLGLVDRQIEALQAKKKVLQKAAPSKVERREARS